MLKHGGNMIGQIKYGESIRKELSAFTDMLKNFLQGANREKFNELMAIMAEVTLILERGSTSIEHALEGKMSNFPFALLYPYDFKKCDMKDPSTLIIENLSDPYSIACEIINSHPDIEVMIWNNFKIAKSVDEKSVVLLVKPRGKNFPDNPYLSICE
jgi:hypothetical protein